MDPVTPDPSPSPVPTCPRCGAPLTGSAAEEGCPRCLLALAMQREPSSRAGDGAPSAAELAALFPEYEIHDRVGRGGMGVVYRAVHRRLARVVALKILLPGLGSDATFVERFEREARALAQLDHPGIVGVHDFGKAGPYCFLALHFVDGCNLRQLAAREGLTRSQSVEFMVQVCEALHFAHGQGIVHRDVKPENLLVDQDGRVRIADFGLAKLLDAPATAPLTRSQEGLGTPHYMAPEQVTGAATVDLRADLYSVGVVLYELLTGELPLGRFPPPSARTPGALPLDAVVMKALATDPARRYQSARELKRDLLAKAPRPAEAPAAAPESRAERERRADRAAAGIPWVLAALLLVGLLLPCAQSQGASELFLRPTREITGFQLDLGFGVKAWLLLVTQIAVAALGTARSLRFGHPPKLENFLAYANFAAAFYLWLAISACKDLEMRFGTYVVLLATILSVAHERRTWRKLSRGRRPG